MSDAWETNEEAQIWAVLNAADVAGTLTASTSGYLGVFEHLEEYPQPSATPTAPTVFGLATTESREPPLAVFNPATEPARFRDLMIDVHRQADAGKGHTNKLFEELRTVFRTASPTGVVFLPQMSETEYHGVEDAYIVDRWRMPYWGGVE